MLVLKKNKSNNKFVKFSVDDDIKLVKQLKKFKGQKLFKSKFL